MHLEQSKAFDWVDHTYMVEFLEVAGLLCTVRLSLS